MIWRIVYWWVRVDWEDGWTRPARVRGAAGLLDEELYGR